MMSVVEDWTWEVGGWEVGRSRVGLVAVRNLRVHCGSPSSLLTYQYMLDYFLIDF